MVLTQVSHFPPNYLLPDERIKLSVAEFSNSKKIFHEITIIQHENFVAKVMAKLR
jgi:hypothetical protein